MIFSFKNQEEVERILARYPVRASALIPLMDLAQKQCHGWLPQNVLEAVADFVGVPHMQALEVATFYTLFHLKPVGKRHIKVCRTLSCWLNGAEEIAEACQVYLKEHDTDCTFQSVECLGYCDRAPVVQINEDNYGNMTEQKMITFLTP